MSRASRTRAMQIAFAHCLSNRTSAAYLGVYPFGATSTGYETKHGVIHRTHYLEDKSCLSVIALEYRSNYSMIH